MSLFAPISPGRELVASTRRLTRSGIWLLDGDERVAHFAFDGYSREHGHAAAAEGRWRFGAEGRWMFGTSGTAWAEDEAGGDVVLSARGAPDARTLMGMRQHLVIEHAGQQFDWQKHPVRKRFTLAGDGVPILVSQVFLLFQRPRFDVRAAPPQPASLSLLVLFAVFLTQRVIATMELPGVRPSR